MYLCTFKSYRTNANTDVFFQKKMKYQLITDNVVTYCRKGTQIS